MLPAKVFETRKRLLTEQPKQKKEAGFKIHGLFIYNDKHPLVKYAKN
jgi:hypothetical protein